MQQPHEPTCILDRLLKPHHGLVFPFTLILGQRGVLGEPVARVRGIDGENEQQGMCRTRDEAEEVPVCEAVDIVHGKALAQAKVVQQCGHELWVGFERDEGDAASVGGHVVGHGGWVGGWLALVFLLLFLVGDGLCAENSVLRKEVERKEMKAVRWEEVFVGFEVEDCLL